jgi:peptidoglycan/xylan/chitin deacetylase (PgdA/CDA1 family)
MLWASAGLHVLAGASLVAAPSRWPAALGAVAASQLALTVAGLLPRCSLLGPNLVRLPGDTDGRVALTFDDGPDPSVTPRVLDLLDRHGAKASFFCIGRLVLAHPGLAREIHERGHRVENHSFRHSNAFAFQGPARLRAEIQRAQDAIGSSLGRAPLLFRAPAGIRNPWLDPVLARLGLRLVSWTRRGFDTVTAAPQRVTARLVRGLAGGDILLLHDGSCARDASGRPVVLQALPELLHELERRGLRSVRVDEAL